MVKYSPFQADLFAMPSLEKQVAIMKQEEEQKNSMPSNVEVSGSQQDTELFSKIKELELRVEELEKVAMQKRGWFRF